MGALLQSHANQAAIENLSRVLGAEGPLALVGAGVSVPAGMPSWSGLLSELERELPPLNEAYLGALRNERDLLWRAEEYRRMIPEQQFHAALQKRFGASATMPPSAPAVALVQLPFRHFLTTNYDDVLLTAHDAARRERPRLLNWSREEDVRTFIFSLRGNAPSRFLLHLHGHHSEPRTMVLTDRDYTDRYVRSFDTARKLFAIFSTERVVFVGFSLSDPDLMALLREVNATMRASDSRHFAIMGLDEPASEMVHRNRLRNRYGVEPVFYDNADGTHRGLLDVLRGLMERHRSVAVPELAAGMIDDEAPERHPINPDDPQKGMWGGSPRHNGREASATVRELDPDWFEVTITVRTVDDARRLKGEVLFYLHPTFIPPLRSVTAHNGVAELRLEAYGAWTVGIEADNGQTRLELDLSTVEDAPMVFRLN